MAVDQHEAMTRACLKDVFNRRDLSSLDKYMSAGEFFPNWSKKNQSVRFFPNKRMYRSRVSQIDMGSFIVVTFPDCLFSSQFSLLDGFRSLFRRTTSLI